MISFSSSFNASYSRLNSLDFQLYQHVATLTEKTSTDYCASKVKPLLVYTQQNCHYERKDLFGVSSLIWILGNFAAVWTVRRLLVHNVKEMDL